MGRTLRPIDPDLVYHVINRQDVLLDNGDRRAFLDGLGKAKGRYPFRLFGYCLMTNHFHLLLRTEPGSSVSRIMQSLTIAHTWRHHRRHASTGHVWQGRFKSPAIQQDGHFWTVLRYIEANPLRAAIVADPDDYPWSSYAAHGLGRADPLLDPIPDWTDLGRTEPLRRAAWRGKVRASLPEADLAAIRCSVSSGRPLGEPAWADAIKAALGLPDQPRPRGRPRKAASP